MSKEIKFRAWDKGNKKMRVVDSIMFHDNRIFLRNDKSNGVIVFEDCESELMQYTGLKDKNEKEIYEGDIVVIATYSHEEPLMDTTCIVEYNEVYGIVEFVELDETGERYSVIDIRDSFHYELEVIGNIYENTELLEGKYNE